MDNLETASPLSNMAQRELKDAAIASINDFDKPFGDLSEKKREAIETTYVGTALGYSLIAHFPSKTQELLIRLGNETNDHSVKNLTKLTGMSQSHISTTLRIARLLGVLPPNEKDRLREMRDAARNRLREKKAVEKKSRGPNNVPFDSKGHLRPFAVKQLYDKLGLAEKTNDNGRKMPGVKSSVIERLMKNGMLDRIVAKAEKERVENAPVALAPVDLPAPAPAPVVDLPQAYTSPAAERSLSINSDDPSKRVIEVKLAMTLEEFQNFVTSVNRK